MSFPLIHSRPSDLWGTTPVVPGDHGDGSAPDDLGGSTELAHDDHHAASATDDLGGPTIHFTEDEVRRIGIAPPPRTSRRLAVGTLEVDAAIPRELGGYRVTGVLASGSMGVVYRGAHPTLHRPVAIKVLHPKLQKNPTVAARFFTEALATARVAHPNVVSCIDFGYDAPGAAYLVLELLEGETLASRLARDRKINVAAALDIAIQIGRALEAAHQQGVVHRDVKPDNIFLCTDPTGASSPTVKLLDFGVAKIVGHDPDTMHTHVGELLGTPSYMAPEQGLSASDSDARSDLYSLGCILFEMVSGVRPFGGNLAETLLAHQTSKRRAARAFNPEIPPALDVLIYRLIARNPATRPGSVTDVVRALAAIKVEARFAIVPGKPRVRPGSERVVTTSAGRRGRRQRWRTAATLIALALAFGIITGALVALRRSSAGAVAPAAPRAAAALRS